MREWSDKDKIELYIFLNQGQSQKLNRWNPANTFPTEEIHNLIKRKIQYLFGWNDSFRITGGRTGCCFQLLDVRANQISKWFGSWSTSLLLKSSHILKLSADASIANRRRSQKYSEFSNSSPSIKTGREDSCRLFLLSSPWIYQNSSECQPILT